MKPFYLIFVFVVLFTSVSFAENSSKDSNSKENTISSISQEEWNSVKVKTMNELLEWIKSARSFSGEAIGATKDFLVEQVPLVVQEIVKFGLVYYSVWCIALITFLIWGILFCRKTSSISWGDAFNDNSFPLNLLRKITGRILVVICLIFLFINIGNLGKVYFAPRLYVISEVTRMLNGNNGHR